jgi:hypothetical protein
LRITIRAFVGGRRGAVAIRVTKRIRESGVHIFR